MEDEQKDSQESPESKGKIVGFSLALNFCKYCKLKILKHGNICVWLLQVVIGKLLHKFSIFKVSHEVIFPLGSGNGSGSISSTN